MTHLELLTLNYLLNALWQIPVIFFAAAAAARLVRPTGPNAEHRIWIVALLLEAILPACAFARGPRDLLLALLGNRSGSVSTHISVLNTPGGTGTRHIAAQLAGVALAAYGIVLLYLAMRLIVRLRRTHVLRRAAHSIILTGERLTIWQHCSRIFGVHDAQLATSTAIAGPSTIGIRHRLVLLPPALLTSLSHDDLAAALAHEFAHMRRRDFAKNLLYELIALPIAWHPFSASLLHVSLCRARWSATISPLVQPMALSTTPIRFSGWRRRSRAPHQPSPLTPSESSMPTTWREES